MEAFYRVQVLPRRAFEISLKNLDCVDLLLGFSLSFMYILRYGWTHL